MDHRAEKGADAIIGKVQWTQKAKEYLKNREYRYLSPTIMVRKDRRVSAVSSVALTNSPAIDGMPAMCKDNGLTKGENTMDLKKLIEVLGLAEDATRGRHPESCEKSSGSSRGTGNTSGGSTCRGCSKQHHPGTFGPSRHSFHSGGECQDA